MSWAICAHDHAHWGPRGAAGLLLAAGGRALLQLRATWAHQGGTWSIPGGARERGEDAVAAALREADEELGLDREAVAVRGAYVSDCGGWTYETVLGVLRGSRQDAHRALVLANRSETDDHAWVAADEVGDLRLHPSFRAAWESPSGELRAFVDRTGDGRLTPA